MGLVWDYLHEQFRPWLQLPVQEVPEALENQVLIFENSNDIFFFNNVKFILVYL